MTVSNVIVNKSYVVAGGNDTYAISFDYTSEDHVIVYVDDGTGNVAQTVDVDYELINRVEDDRGNTLATSIQFKAASQPPDGDSVVLSREVGDLIQEEDFLDGDPVPQEKFEDGLDKIVLALQEVSDGQDRSVSLPVGSVPSSVDFPSPGAGEYIKWNAAGTALETGAIDLTTINNSIASLQLEDSALDSKITTNKNNIATNVSNIAINAAAIAGQATTIGNNTTRIGINEGNIATIQGNQTDYNNRISALELVDGVRSSQTILNNQVAYVELTDFAFDGDVHDYAVADYVINRATDTNYLSEVGTLHIVMRKNNVWTFENGLQLVDIAGLTLKVETLAGNICKLSYISTNVTGTSYAAKMRYTIKKYEV